MTALRIAFESEPDLDDLAALGRALDHFNAEHGGPDNFERIVVSARDQSGALRGGLLAATYWGWLFVDLLLVEEAYRGQGAGTELLARAEKIAVDRGVTRAFLDTLSFQAEGFCERRGYVIFGALDDFPPGHRRVWMTKILA